MKLMYCPACGDLIKLTLSHRQCGCGKSTGYYLSDGQHAVIIGPAIPLGIANSSFHQAIANQPERGQGLLFEAFVIPKECKTVITMRRERDAEFLRPGKRSRQPDHPDDD